MTFPELDRYLAQLPNGFDSYPAAHAKGSVVLPYLVGAVGASLRRCADLPAPLRALLDAPPTVAGWVPEVTLAALIVAAYEAHFASAGGPDALQAFILETNRATLSGPAYRILFMVASPERLLGGAAQRWAAFHRGSTLSLARRADGVAELDLAHPPAIFPEHSFRGHGATFALAAELAGGRNVRMSWAHARPGLTRYTVTWR